MGVEREDEYSVNVGFLQGAIDATLVVSVNIILETPTSKYDKNCDHTSYISIMGTKYTAFGNYYQKNKLRTS